MLGLFIEEKLGLKVNMMKSKVDRPRGIKYLGFGFCFDTGAHQFKEKPHAKSVAKFKKRLTSFGLVSMLDYYTERCVTC